MIQVGPQDDGEMRILFQEKDGLGNYMNVNLDDHQGLKLWLDIYDFYRKKGHNMARLLDNAPNAKPTRWGRFKTALAYFLGD